MTAISPPFFVFEGLDLSIYDSLNEIEANLEGVDVEGGLYEAFDSMGRVIGLKATGVKRGKFTVDIGKTHVETIAATSAGAERLSKLLHDHLLAFGRSVPNEANLHDLVLKCEALHRHER
jgi:hypothetical protein